MNKISSTLNKISNWYSELESIQKLLFTIIMVIILIVVVTIFYKIDFSTKILNYNDISSQSIVENCEIISDREVYLNCNTVIENLILSYNNEYIIENRKITLNDFYKNALFSEYNISKSKFKKKISKINSDILGNNKDVINIKDFYPLIKNIYLYSSEYKMYFVELNTETLHLIGIQYTGDRFYIFYVE